jgi:hypothetical protein
LDGEDFILKVHRVFTHIRSGVLLVASSGGTRGSADYGATAVAQVTGRLASTDPVISRPVIMYTSAKVGDIGLWPKRKALMPFDQKWQAAIKRLSFLGVSARDSSKH